MNIQEALDKKDTIAGSYSEAMAIYRGISAAGDMYANERMNFINNNLQYFQGTVGDNAANQAPIQNMFFDRGAN